MLSINNNMMAISAGRNLGSAYADLAVNTARMSSGLRINSARDDAAGLAVRELMRADTATLRQGSRNVSDGISMTQTAEGAAGTISDKLTRMKELATQASNGTYSDAQKSIMQKEFNQLAEDISQTARSTEFNGNKLLDSDGSIDISTGNGDSLSVSTKDMSLTNLSGLDLVSDPSTAMQEINTAIEGVSEFRGGLGAQMNRMESTGEVLDIEAENITAAESRISDVDYAKEVAKVAANAVQSQAGIAMQVQAKTMPMMALKLIN